MSRSGRRKCGRMEPVPGFTPRRPERLRSRPLVPSSPCHYPPAMFQAIQVAYWLALSTWFGGVLFIAIAAPIIFRTVRDADPTLPKVLSVNLESQHSSLLAGTIVTNLMEMLTRIHMLCAAVLLLSIIGQWFFISHQGLE